MIPIKTNVGNDGMNGPKLASKTTAPEMRRPPAYQTYASDDLASEAYYGLSLASRGLFDAMLRVIWVNGYVPKEPHVLAKAVRADPVEATSALVPELLEQFVPFQDDPRRLTYPELDRQRANLERQRQQQRVGGKKGANRRYGRRPGSGNPMGQPMGPEMKCNELNRTDKKRTRSLSKDPFSSTDGEIDSWRMEYADAEGKLAEAERLAMPDEGAEYDD